MRRKVWLTIVWVALGGVAAGQIKRQFTVENAPSCEIVKLRLKSNSGNCYIKPSQNSEILNVYSNQDADAYSHNFTKEVVGKTCEVNLSLEENRANGLGQTISTRFFGTSEPSSNTIWKMYLTESTPYQLELNYGVGNANVDLSGLAIQNLKINTGSADVVIGYNSLGNQVEMDSLTIKVDLGSIKVKNLNLSRSRHVLADVGFGNMLLDFSNQPVASNHIKGSVGAGTLVIVLPNPDIPVLVKIHDSWLCSVTMPKGLKKIGDNTFASQTYTADATNALTFDLDVSMGKIIFKEK
ncbi:MAG: hypothetical protein HC859_00885 [Bacteroidia bacterium]|nr:hypothetical protein [Bacteroidia bacterium]